MSTSTGVTPAERDDKDVLWGFFEEGEEYAEKYVPAMKRLAGDEIPLIKAGSLAILAFGIRSYRSSYSDRPHWRLIITCLRTMVPSMAP